MNYIETKEMLELCQRSLSYHGCEPVADDIQTALNNLEYAKMNDLIE
jgi:hypothetical protein|tara:strand:- start:20 stop:160 length:141 start_codon:yes stop_codon:yes gene_type:complete